MKNAAQRIINGRCGGSAKFSKITGLNVHTCRGYIARDLPRMEDLTHIYHSLREAGIQLTLEDLFGKEEDYGKKES